MEQITVSMLHLELFTVGSSRTVIQAIRHEYEDCEKITESVIEIHGGHSYRQDILREEPNIVPFQYCGECLAQAIKAGRN